jgi:hypothetical protein
MITIEINAQTKVVCEVHRTELQASFNFGSNRIEIRPCTSCIEAACKAMAEAANIGRTA